MLILDSICTDERVLTAIKLAKMLLQLMQILIPIALIVLGSIDLGKAVISSDDGAAKKGQKRFINRCIAAVLVFLSALIVRTAMGYIGNTAWQDCWDAASPAILPSGNGNTDETGNYNEDGFRGGTSPGGKTHSSGGMKF